MLQANAVLSGWDDGCGFADATGDINGILYPIAPLVEKAVAGVELIRLPGVGSGLEARGEISIVETWQAESARGWPASRLA